VSNAPALRLWLALGLWLALRLWLARRLWLGDSCGFGLALIVCSLILRSWLKPDH
jgi:hypothetical protein